MRGTHVWVQVVVHAEVVELSSVYTYRVLPDAVTRIVPYEDPEVSTLVPGPCELPEEPHAARRMEAVAKTLPRYAARRARGLV
jgi:hypothetical protein